MTIKTIKELEAEILHNQHKIGDVSTSLDQRDAKWRNIKNLKMQLKARKDVLELIDEVFEGTGLKNLQKELKARIKGT